MIDELLDNFLTHNITVGIEFMKKNRLLLSVLASAFIAAGAHAADGTITFTGHVTAPVCTTVVGAGPTGGSMSPSPTITLPTVATSAFSATAITTTGHTPFSISLTGCEKAGSLGNVRAVFSTTAAAAGADGNLVANTGGAANVGIAIMTPGHVSIGLNGNAAVDPGAALPEGTAGPITMNYVAAYKSVTAAAVGDGSVEGTLEYTISYF